jgi:hypothetical protein
MSQLCKPSVEGKGNKTRERTSRTAARARAARRALRATLRLATCLARAGACKQYQDGDPGWDSRMGVRVGQWDRTQGGSLVVETNIYINTSNMARYLIMAYNRTAQPKMLGSAYVALYQVRMLHLCKQSKQPVRGSEYM